VTNIYHAVVLLNRITGFARPSVRPYVSYGLWIRKKNKIGFNVLRGRSNRDVNF